ncbi:MAG: NAD(P)-dependent oxidoreductase [Streptosporangiaceae bacterium]
MKVTIFGASGATGTCLVRQALDAGHQVVAVVRDPARLTVPAQPGLQVTTADVTDPASATPAVADADAVITAVAPHGTGRSTLRQGSTRSIVQAMHKTGARRLLFVSGSIVTDRGDSPYLRYLIKPVVRRTFLRDVTADFLAAEAEIQASGLDWTIFRPPSLTGKPARGTCRVAADRNLPRCFSITRADLAACMLSVLNDTTASHRHLCVAN